MNNSKQKLFAVLFVFLGILSLQARAEIFGSRIGWYAANAIDDLYPSPEKACEAYTNRASFQNWYPGASFVRVEPNGTDPGRGYYCFLKIGENDRINLFNAAWVNEAGIDFKPPCTAGNPVDPYSGTKYDKSTDYGSGAAGSLVFERNYRSNYSGGLGAMMAPGWYTSYSRSIAGGILEDFAFVKRDDGSILNYNLIGGNFVSGDSSDKNILRKTKDQTGSVIGYEYDVFDDDSTEVYDAFGLLSSIKSRNGLITTIARDGAGKLIAVRDSRGRELKFVYDGYGRLVEMLPPGALSGSLPGAVSSPIRYGYEEASSLGSGVASQGQLTSVTWQDGTVRRYHYEDQRFPWALTGITDEAGQRFADYAYDNVGRVVRTEHAGGVDRLDFEYDTSFSGQPVTVVTDSSGLNGSPGRIVYTFDTFQGMRRLASTSAPCSLCGNIKANTYYNSKGFVERAIAHDGTVTFYAYDAKGRETERAQFSAAYQGETTRPALGAALQVVSSQWHATWNLPTQVAEPGKISAYTYDSRGNLTGQSWAATADANGSLQFGAAKTGSTYATGRYYDDKNLQTKLLEYIDGAQTGNWTTTYGPTWDVASIKDELTGLVGTAAAYDANGRLLSGANSSGKYFSMTYDVAGRLSSYANDGLSMSMSFRWTSFGAIARIDGPSGDVVIYEYDAAQRLMGIRQSAASSTISNTDWMGRLRFALRRLIEIPISTVQAQVILPPLIPVPNGPLPNFGRPLPVPVEPDGVLMPSRGPHDANRDLARRLGESVDSVVSRLICSDECKQLQVKIQERTNELRKRFFDMAVDKKNLYCLNPQGGRQTWQTHQDKYQQQQLNLNRLIARAKTLKCPYNPEADLWASRVAPICPD